MRRAGAVRSSTYLLCIFLQAIAKVPKPFQYTLMQGGDIRFPIVTILAAWEPRYYFIPRRDSLQCRLRMKAGKSVALGGWQFKEILYFSGKFETP